MVEIGTGFNSPSCCSRGGFDGWVGKSERGWSVVVEGIAVVGRLWVMGRVPRRGCLKMNFAWMKLNV
jgi:hypothetical protein